MRKEKEKKARGGRRVVGGGSREEGRETREVGGRRVRVLETRREVRGYMSQEAGPSPALLRMEKGVRSREKWEGVRREEVTEGRKREGGRGEEI